MNRNIRKMAERLGGISETIPGKMRRELHPSCMDFGGLRRNRENRGQIAGGLSYFCKMNFSDETILISIDSLLEEKMRIIKGEKVLLDFELAELLQVSTQDLIRQVRVSKDRFRFAACRRW